jgi:alkylation response protein AidB-like acyl-CoA dehydrogenase
MTPFDLPASTTPPVGRTLDPRLSAWLDVVAEGLDQGGQDPAIVLPRLAGAGLLAPEPFPDAIETIAAVSERSLACGFVLWSHRAYTELVRSSPNARLRAELLPALGAGTRAGAPAMSNAMKHLAGMEPPAVRARARNGGYCLSGTLPFATNLRPQGFEVAIPAALEDGRILVVSLPSGLRGLTRSPDLELNALRCINTAAIHLEDARVGEDRILHPDAADWLGRVRPVFLSLQCAMSIGVARRSLAEAAAHARPGRGALSAEIDQSRERLAAVETALKSGVGENVFLARPRALFEIRIALADRAAEAVRLELLALGAKAFLRDGPGRGFARRAREAAVLPIVTPSVMQLRAALAGESGPASPSRPS